MDGKLTPARVPPPGRLIRREIEARGWTQKDLAAIMDRPEKTISEIVNGHKKITTETALQLAAAFGTSADLWLNLESSYRLHLARKSQDVTDVELKSKLYSMLPLRQMARRGWIDIGCGVQELKRRVEGFLGVPDLEQVPAVMGSLRRSEAHGEPAVRAQTAWVKRVEYLAGAQNVGDYSRDRLVAHLPRLLDLSYCAADVARVPEFLLDHGVRFVIVPQLEHTYTDGAALHLGSHPVVAITLRYDRIDNFWFTLLHELGHVVAGHAGGYLDNLKEPSESPEEDEANALAHRWLIPPEALAQFVRATTPRYSLKKIEAFAGRIHRHPGIVVGQLQHDDEIEYNHFRPTLVGVSPHLRPWIDVSEPGVAA